MPTDAPPRRPFYRRKRWLAAGLLWLALAYPLSYGPAEYLTLRGWLPAHYVRPFRPALAIQNAPLVGRPYAAYLVWWLRLAPEREPQPGDW